MNERAVSSVSLVTSDTFSLNKNAWKCIKDKIKVQEYAVSYVSSDTVSQILPNPAQNPPSS